MIRLTPLAALLCLCLACDDDDPGGTDGGAPDAGADAAPSWDVAFDATETGALLSVWGARPDDIWAVGGQPESGVAWRYDGAAWAKAPLPDGPLINWVHGASADDVWLVGEQGRIVRWRDGAFEEALSPTARALWGVWAAAPDDVWAVGGDAADFESDPDPVLLRFNGTEWNRYQLPEVDREYRALFKIWGTRADHVFAVGSRGVVLHYDGEGWTQQGSGTGDDLISLWGRADDDIVVVGGRGNGVVARWDGESWTSEKLPGVPGLNGVWMNERGEATLVGDRGRVVRIPTESFEPSFEPTDTTFVLHGVFGLPDGRRVAVGGTLGERPPWDGVALWSE